MEMFQSFGFAETVEREAYWVSEATFWKPDPDDPARIIRNGHVRNFEDDLSHIHTTPTSPPCRTVSSPPRDGLD